MSFVITSLARSVSGFNWIAESPGDRDNIRKVRWIGRVNRDDLLTQIKNRVRSIATLLMVNEEPAQEIRDLLTQYYDNTDSETRSLVPLVKLYWPE